MQNQRVLAFGIVVADVFCPPLDGIPKAGSLVQVPDIEFHCGGCAANVAIGLARLDVDVSLVGKVGPDFFGRAAVDYLETHRVRTDSVTPATRFSTSKTVILTVKGEDRRFIHCFGANVALSAEDLAGAIAERSFDIIYVGGYLAAPGVNPTEMAVVLGKAREAGSRIVLDVVLPTANPDVARIRKDLAPVLPQTDYFMPNDDEAGAITGLTDNKAQADYFLGMGAKNVILTRGAEGSYFKSATKEWFEPPNKVDCVDGSGAGDAFDAGLIYGLLEGLDTKQAMKLASAYGASACRGVGCTTSLLSRGEMDKLL